MIDRPGSSSQVIVSKKTCRPANQTSSYQIRIALSMRESRLWGPEATRRSRDEIYRPVEVVGVNNGCRCIPREALSLLSMSADLPFLIENLRHNCGF
jgi:hypothetical protein